MRIYYAMNAVTTMQEYACWKNRSIHTVVPTHSRAKLSTPSMIPAAMPFAIAPTRKTSSKVASKLKNRAYCRTIATAWK